MSYQEYADLGPKRPSMDRDRQHKRRSSRPYVGSNASFSVPRQTPQHSNSSSISTSLTPSSSSQNEDVPLGTALEVASENPRLAQMSKESVTLTEKSDDLVSTPLPWRPFYLQRRILASFVAIAATLIGTLEALLEFSNQNAGLGDTNQTARHLWQYGATAVLAAVAGLWSRVEFQAKSAAPWIRMSREPADAERTLLLDYLTMFQPRAIFRAIQNRDMVVACTALVSVTFKVLIIISTAFVTPSLVGVPNQNSPLVLQSSFINNASGLSNVGALPFFAMAGLLQDNLTYPPGTSAQFAYQQISSDLSADTIVQAEVDGFSAELDCQEAQFTVSGVQYSQFGIRFNSTFSTPGCTVNFPVLLGQGFSNGSQSFLARFGQSSCGNSTGVDDQRIVILLGLATIDPSSLPSRVTASSTSINGTISQSAQLLCRPSYNISRVDVQKNGTALLDISLASQPNNRTLSNVQPWNIAQAFFQSYQSQPAASANSTSSSAFEPQSAPTDADTIMSLALGLRFKSTGTLPPLQTFFSAGSLYGLANEFFQQYTALLAAEALAQQDSVPALGTAILTRDRLVVRTLAVQLMVSLLGFAMLLTITGMFLVPRKGFLPRDPSTVIAMATLLAHSRPLVQLLRGAGGADSTDIHERLKGTGDYYTGVEPYDHTSQSDLGYFRIFGGPSTQDPGVGVGEHVEPREHWPYPFSLHPLPRAAALLVVAVLIVVLEFSLRTSDSNSGSGFGEVGDDTIRHFLWTTVPALVATMVAVFLSSADFATRVLAPYAQLRRSAPFERSIGLNVLDRSNPAVLYESIITRNIAVLSAASAVLFGSLLVTATAPLFSAASVPTVVPVQLLTQDFFSASDTVRSDFCVTCDNGTMRSSLILNANFSFPAFTYNDLAFPGLVASSLSGIESSIPDNTSFTATVTAARPLMACQFFPQAEMETNLTVNYTLGDFVNPLRIDFSGQPRFGDGELSSALTIGTALNPLVNNPTKTIIDPNSFFGAASYQPISLGNGTVLSRWVYAWGQLTNANTNQTTVQGVSGLVCNESMQELEASATFVGSALAIDPSRPPLPVESTARAADISLPEGNLQYADLANVSTPYLLDAFFASLVTSQFAIPAADLGSQSNDTAATVSSAIVAQHRLIRTQVVSTWNRQATASNTSAAVAYPAMAQLPGDGGRRRVVQDSTSTRILQSLLATALAFSILAWAAFPRPNHVLPRSPCGIASVAALLADGNLFGFLGRGAEWQPAGELQEPFRDGLHVTARFELGWRQVRRRRRGVASEAGEQAFAISAVRTGGWGGGEAVGLGMRARVAYAQWNNVRDWGYRT